MSIEVQTTNVSAEALIDALDTLAAIAKNSPDEELRFYAAQEILDFHSGPDPTFVLEVEAAEVEEPPASTSVMAFTDFTDFAERFFGEPLGPVPGGCDDPACPACHPEEGESFDDQAERIVIYDASADFGV